VIQIASLATKQSFAVFVYQNSRQPPSPSFGSSAMPIHSDLHVEKFRSDWLGARDPGPRRTPEPPLRLARSSAVHLKFKPRFVVECSSIGQFQ